jgi:hypothetical protein
MGVRRAEAERPGPPFPAGSSPLGNPRRGRKRVPQQRVDDGEGVRRDHAGKCASVRCGPERVTTGRSTPTARPLPDPDGDLYRGAGETEVLA